MRNAKNQKLFICRYINKKKKKAVTNYAKLRFQVSFSLFISKCRINLQIFIYWMNKTKINKIKDSYWIYYLKNQDDNSTILKSVKSLPCKWRENKFFNKQNVFQYNEIAHFKWIFFILFIFSSIITS